MGRLSWALLVTCDRSIVSTAGHPSGMAEFTAPTTGRTSSGPRAGESIGGETSRYSASGYAPHGRHWADSCLGQLLAPINSTESVPTAGSESPVPTELMFNLVLITLAVLTLLGLFLKWGPTWMRSSPSKPQLQVCDSLALQRDAYVKLIRVGSERVVVAQDRHGLSMVLLPPKFEKVLDDAKAEDHRRLSARDLKLTFSRPEGNGWDLSQPIS